MATCDLDALKESACANLFDCVEPGSVEESSVELQLLYQAAASSQSLAQLQTAACANRFTCVKPGSVEESSVELQLLCDAIAAAGG